MPAPSLLEKLERLASDLEEDEGDFRPRYAQRGAVRPRPIEERGPTLDVPEQDVAPSFIDPDAVRGARDPRDVARARRRAAEAPSTSTPSTRPSTATPSEPSLHLPPPPRRGPVVLDEVTIEGNDAPRRVWNTETESWEPWSTARVEEAAPISAESEWEQANREHEESGGEDMTFTVDETDEWARLLEEHEASGGQTMTFDLDEDGNVIVVDERQPWELGPPPSRMPEPDWRGYVRDARRAEREERQEARATRRRDRQRDAYIEGRRNRWPGYEDEPVELTEETFVGPPQVAPRSAAERRRRRQQQREIDQHRQEAEERGGPDAPTPGLVAPEDEEIGSTTEAVTEADGSREERLLREWAESPESNGEYQSEFDTREQSSTRLAAPPPPDGQPSMGLATDVIPQKPAPPEYGSQEWLIANLQEARRRDDEYREWLLGEFIDEGRPGWRGRRRTAYRRLESDPRPYMDQLEQLLGIWREQGTMESENEQRSAYAERQRAEARSVTTESDFRAELEDPESAATQRARMSAQAFYESSIRANSEGGSNLETPIHALTPMPGQQGAVNHARAMLAWVAQATGYDILQGPDADMARHVQRDLDRNYSTRDGESWRGEPQFGRGSTRNDALSSTTLRERVRAGYGMTEEEFAPIWENANEPERRRLVDKYGQQHVDDVSGYYEGILKSGVTDVLGEAGSLSPLLELVQYVQADIERTGGEFTREAVTRANLPFTELLWGTREEAQRIRQLFLRIQNLELKDRSGAAVTPPEFARLRDEFGSGIYSGEKAAANILRALNVMYRRARQERDLIRRQHRWQYWADDERRESLSYGEGL